MAGAKTEFTIEVDDQGVKDALARLAAAGVALKPAMQDIGEYMDRIVDDRFNNQKGPDGTAWAANTTVTAARKRNPKILHERVMLRGSIQYRATDSEMEQGANMEYAAVHQFGAKQGAFGKTKRGGPIPWGDIPARPMLGFSDEDIKEIEEILNGHLTTAFEGGR